MKTQLSMIFALCSFSFMGCGDAAEEKTTTTTTKSKVTLKGGSSLAALKLAGVDTKAAKMTYYEFWLAKEADCSNPIAVFKNTAGKEVDMMVGPEIGSGELEQGTYNCVIMVMSDTTKFTPAATTGNCTIDQEYTLDVFQPQGETYKPTGKLPDGTVVTGAVGAQKMAVYISTMSTSTGGEMDGNPFEAPTASKPKNGIKLTSPMKITADIVGTMVMDTTGRVESNGQSCDMQPPEFGFK
jgi:hypothetical protein